jgi:hypothetical protein
MSLRSYIYDNLSPLGLFIYDTVGSLICIAVGIFLLRSQHPTGNKELMFGWIAIVIGAGYALFALFRYLHWRANNRPRRRNKRRRRRSESARERR